MKLNRASDSELALQPRAIAFDGATTVANSVFWHNTDQAAAQGFAPDSPAGVWVAPADDLGFFTNNPTFTTTHSTYS